MKRPPKPQGAASVSLFPFLAVLLCTMGALIVLLVVIAQQARAQAARAAAAKLQQSDDLEAEAEAQWQDYQDQAAQLDGRLTGLRAQLEGKRRDAALLEAELARLKGRLADLEDRAGKLDEKLAEAADDKTVEQLRRQIGAYRKRIEDVSAEIRTARSRKPGSAYAIVPYSGPNGTQRRPIYIECRQDSIVLQPEGTVLLASDFPIVKGRVPIGNPLEAALQATIRHWETTSSASGRPYPMLLVRPDGIDSYEAALSALGYLSGQQRFDFGYELVDADWDLAFDEPNRELAAEQRAAATQARQMLAARYGNRGGGSSDPVGRGFASEGEGTDGFGLRVAADGGGLESVGRDGLPILSMPDPYGPMGYGPGGDEYGALDRAFPSSPGGDPASSDRYGGDAAPSFSGGGESDEQNPYTMFGGGSSGTQPGTSASSLGSDGTGGARTGIGGATNSSGPAFPGDDPRVVSGGTNPYQFSTTTGGTSGRAGGESAGATNTQAAPSASSFGGPTSERMDSGPRLGGPLAEGGGEPSEYAASGAPADSTGVGGAGTQSAGNAGGTSGSVGGVQDASSMPGEGAPNVSFGVAPDHSNNRSEPIANQRGQDWALKAPAARSSAIWRYITVVVDDELIWVATGGSGPAAWKAIPYNGATLEAVAPLQRNVWEIMESWGLAGRGMHWRPVLHAQVTSQGESRFRELELLLHDSGFKLERKPGKSAYQPGTATARE
jgi:hypothetical protein